MTWMLAHGIGGIQNLPIPRWVFFAGAAGILTVSFLGLFFLWPKPVLAEKARGGRTFPGWLERFLLSPGLRVVVGALSFALLVFLWLGALYGKDDAGVNFTPTFVYVFFWVGMPIVSAVFGYVWRYLDPWRSAAEGVGWAANRLGLRDAPPFEYPARLGRWPAAVLLLSFTAMELSYTDPSNPRALALAIGIYSAITWFGAVLFGSKAWFANGDGFAVDFQLLSRISPFGRREDGHLYVRVPFSGLSIRDTTAGTIPFVAVMLGTTFFDGFSRTSIWQYKYSFSWYNVQVDLIDRPHLADIVGQLMNVGGMLVCVLFVGLSFRLAIAGTESIGERKGLAPEFVDSLIPIALVYVIAHYFSLLVFQGEVGYKLVSDPWGRGWDLFGTHNFTPNFTFLTPHMIWYVEVGALVIGHVAGLAVAHDRAVGIFRSPRLALWAQYPMLILMIVFTTGGLWVLSQK
jgi:hypothetical protein